MRRLARKLPFVFLAVTVSVVIALVCGELAATAYYVLRERGYVAPRARLAAERNAYVETARTQTMARPCHYGDSLVFHPFLAFVQTALGPCGASYANSKALIGKEFPDTPSPRTGIVLVTGGSVAAQLVWDNRERDSPLERLLNAEFTGARFDRFIVLNGGHGAWRQPNQYVLFGLYADVLAGVITLDGFNEHYMVGSPSRFEKPAANFFQVIERQDPRVTSAPLAMAALKLDADLYRWASGHAVVRLSNLAYLVVDSLRSKLRGYASRGMPVSDQRDAEWVNATYARMFAFKDGLGREERATWAIQQYQKYIRLMHAGATAFGIKSLFLVQPIPGWGKTLTDQERAFARETDRDRYKRMADELATLRQQYGIPAHSLLEVFRDERGQIYKDAVHVNARGNEILAGHIADLIEKEWRWPRKPRHTRSPVEDVSPPS